MSDQSKQELDAAFDTLQREVPDPLCRAIRWLRNPKARVVSADLGLVVEEVGRDWVGEIVQVERDLGTVTLEDRHRKRRTFPLGPGFMLEGRPVVQSEQPVLPHLIAPEPADGPRPLTPWLAVGLLAGLGAGVAPPARRLRRPRKLVDNLPG